MSMISHQKLRLKRTSLALLGGLVHTLVCFSLWYVGLFRTSLETFILIFAGLWVGHLAFLIMIISNLNLRFKDPSLTYPQLMWSQISIMITLYYLDDLRSLLLLFTLFGLVFGAFQLSKKQLWSITVFTVVLYICTILLLAYNHPALLVPSKELIVAFMFIFVACSFAAVVADLGSTREYLHKQKMELESSLYVVQSNAETDELTGLKNRRYILDILEQQHGLVDRHKNYCFSLAMIDIDQFKLINDTFGHSVGDQVLKIFAKLVEQHLRKTDYFARVGGEEFLLVAPFTRKDQIKTHVERLRIALETTNFDKILKNLKVTCSAGVTDFRWPESAEDTLKRADKALYRAKTDGRNRIVED